jgi:hypothetical protein
MSALGPLPSRRLNGSRVLTSTAKVSLPKDLVAPRDGKQMMSVAGATQ